MIYFNTDNKGKVVYINNTGHRKDEKFSAENLPEPEQREGYIPVMYYRNGRIEYEYESVEPYTPPQEDPDWEKQAYAEQVRHKVQNMYYAATMAEKINTFDLSNKEALAVKDLYPEWKVGIDVKVNEKYRLGEDLWQVVQAHKTQENWKPSLATASLWKHIDEEHEGTENDPIPYAPPMQIYLGKYYTQGGVVYKCTRDSGIPLSHNLSDLVGLYVQKV